MNKNPSSAYKVRFNDCDMFGHLNNARYLDYMINARQDHLKETYDFDFNHYYKNNRGWVVTYHEIQYLKPAFFDETVWIQSGLLSMDADSLYIEILMMNETQTHLKAILRSKLTFIDLKTGKREQHPENFVEWAQGLVTGNLNIPIQERINQLLGLIKKDQSGTVAR